MLLILILMWWLMSTAMMMMMMMMMMTTMCLLCLSVDIFHALCRVSEWVSERAVSWVDCCRLYFNCCSSVYIHNAPLTFACFQSQSPDDDKLYDGNTLCLRVYICTSCAVGNFWEASEIAGQENVEKYGIETLHPVPHFSFGYFPASTFLQFSLETNFHTSDLMWCGVYFPCCGVSVSASSCGSLFQHASSGFGRLAA